MVLTYSELMDCTDFYYLQRIKERMRELLNKYPDGFNGFKEQKTASPQPAHEDAIDDIARSEVDSSSASVAVH